MLLYVPRMYTESEFKKQAATLPHDFEPKTKEFWSYVEEKLAMFIGKVQRVYRDEICKGGDEALNQLCTIDAANFRVVRSLIENGAKLEATEDSLLVAESDSWLEMAEQHPDLISLQLREGTMRERDAFVSEKIEETLGDDECGVLFIDPARQPNFNKNIKVIRVCRFDPSDYLRSWRVSTKE